MPIKNKLDAKTYNDFIALKNYLSKYTKRAYLVGGAVRDIYINNTIKDLDIEVYDIEQKKLEKILKKIGAMGVGKKFFVYKWKNIDISLPRIEKKIGHGHKAFDVKVAFDEKTASKRRDFTMNALMLNIFNGNLLDFWDGRKDIENKIIRIVDEKSFKEDSLRVLRAVQFSARLGFKCDKNSVKLMKEIDLNDLSKERIFWEFEKLFNAKNLHIGIYYLFKLDIIQKLFSITVECKDFIAILKEFILYQNNFVNKYYQFYFIYIVSKILKIDIFNLLERINAPKEYYRFYKLQPKLSKKTDDMFLLKTALKIPLNSWLENYNPYIKKRAVELNIFNQKFKTNIKSLDIVKDGFEGSQISKEIQRRELKYIDRYLKSIN